MAANREVVWEGRFLRMVKQGAWEHCERTNCTWAVVVAPLTAQDEVVFVEQFRPPIGTTCIEFPAGLVGDHAAVAGEDALVAAARELEEETGFRAQRLELVARGPVSPGLTTEMIMLVTATGLTRVSQGGGVDDEVIRVHLVPFLEVENWLAAASDRGAMIDPKLYSGLYFLGRLRKSQP